MWWRKKEHEQDVSFEKTETRTWELKASDSLTTRAKILAELALSDFVNDRHGLTERAAFRIAEALEHYVDLDKKYETTKASPPPPPPDRALDGVPIVPTKKPNQSKPTL